MQINEDGTMTELENIAVEGDLSPSEIVALEEKIDDLLQGMEYIEGSAIKLFYRPENTEVLCFQANLLGENLEEYTAEISGIIKAELGSCNLDHSSIVDVASGIVYPVQ